MTRLPRVGLSLVSLSWLIDATVSKNQPSGPSDQRPVEVSTSPKPLGDSNGLTLNQSNPVHMSTMRGNQLQGDNVNFELVPSSVPTADSPDDDGEGSRRESSRNRPNKDRSAESARDAQQLRVDSASAARSPKAAARKEPRGASGTGKRASKPHDPSKSSSNVVEAWIDASNQPGESRLADLQQPAQEGLADERARELQSSLQQPGAGDQAFTEARDVEDTDEDGDDDLSDEDSSVDFLRDGNDPFVPRGVGAAAGSENGAEADKKTGKGRRRSYRKKTEPEEKRDNELIKVTPGYDRSKDDEWDMSPTTSFAFLSILLLGGKFLRVTIKPLRDLYLPSSVIGGTFGYLLLMVLKYIPPYGCVNADSINRITEEDISKGAALPGTAGLCKDNIGIAYSFIDTFYRAGWRELPSVLICVIFAAVFIGVEVPPLKAVWEGSGPQIMYGQIVTHGLWFWGLLTGWLFGFLFYSAKSTYTDTASWAYYFMVGDESKVLPKNYGTTMYLGFEGGHGTVAGLANEFDKWKFSNTGDDRWTDGSDVALAMATTGLLGATVFGIMFINIAARRGWLTVHQREDGDHSDPMLVVGVYSPESRRPMGYETVVSDSIDTLTLHAALVGLACAFGYGIQKAICGVEELLVGDHGLFPPAPDAGPMVKFGKNFPTFPLCMVGGILVDKLVRSLNYEMVIDHNCMQRVSGLALDYLICAVLCAMDLQAVFGWPFAFSAFIALNVIGFAWHFLCILWLAPKILPDCWFERAIFEVGHSMGTTANGLILLKMVDPHSETGASSAVAFKLFVHEPMMGVWVACVAYTYNVGIRDDYAVLGWAGASGVMLIFWFAMYFFYFKRKYSEAVKDRNEFCEQELAKRGDSSMSPMALEMAKESRCDVSQVLSRTNSIIGNSIVDRCNSHYSEKLHSDKKGSLRNRGGSRRDSENDANGGNGKFYIRGDNDRKDNDEPEGLHVTIDHSSPKVIGTSCSPELNSGDKRTSEHATDLGHLMALSSALLRKPQQHEVIHQDRTQDSPHTWHANGSTRRAVDDNMFQRIMSRDNSAQKLSETPGNLHEDNILRSSFDHNLDVIPEKQDV